MLTTLASDIVLICPSLNLLPDIKLAFGRGVWTWLTLEL